MRLKRIKNKFFHRKYLSEGLRFYFNPKNGQLFKYQNAFMIEIRQNKIKREL